MHKDRANLNLVIPAKAGIHLDLAQKKSRITAAFC